MEFLAHDKAQEGGGYWIRLALGDGITDADDGPATINQLSWNEFFAYVLVQAIAAIGGVILAHLMFEVPFYGLTHPTINELRLAYADVKLTHPLTGKEFSAGRIRVSQAEVVSTTGGTPEKPMLELGFCATLGWNEVKVIAASMLDLEMDKPNPHPAHKEEFVLYHTEAVEASGFCIHFKLPHYVTFSSSMDNIRQVHEAQTRGMFEGMFVQSLTKAQPNGTTAQAAESTPVAHNGGGQ